MDIAQLLRALQTGGDLLQVARNPLVQFGPANRQYLGATLLPERPVPQNEYTEQQVKYRTVIANAGTRYSPTQKKSGALVGSFAVKLAESDIADEITSREYDVLLQLANSNASMDVMAQVIRFADIRLTRPLVEWNERARWQAIVDAEVLLRGDNEYAEDVAYSDPAGHRFVAGGTWSDDAYDPFDDIYAGAQLLADKGYRVSRIVSSSVVTGIMGRNAKVAARTNRIVVSAAGQIQGINSRLQLADINAALAGDELPPIERYDLRYRTSTGTGRFLADDVMVLIGETETEEQLDLGDTLEILPNTLGYMGVGRAAGQATPGRVVRTEHKEDKPPRIEGEGWQTSLPVILEPEAIVVIKTIA